MLLTTPLLLPGVLFIMIFSHFLSHFVSKIFPHLIAVVTSFLAICVLTASLLSPHCMAIMTDSAGAGTGPVVLGRLTTLRWPVGVSVSLSFYVTGISLSLLFIANPSISNPGPRKPSVLYANVQGLISPGHLSMSDPPLNMTKVYELQDYIYSNKIDIIILNETWLKNKIDSNSVFPLNYKTYRVDRSAFTHPRDPNKPSKFREHGGGVLIAHRDNINVNSVKFSGYRAKAELLTISLSFSSGKKLCVSTFYRVGNLGLENFSEFREHFNTIFTRRNIVKHVLIGDFNFPGISWPSSYPRTGVEDSFLSYLLDDLGHVQLINSPTHVRGRTLDLLFTNDPQCVSNISVLDHDSVCSSDHHPITFNINLDVKSVKDSRRVVRLFDKGDYVSMNAELSAINWREHFSGNIEQNVTKFNSIVGELVEQYIPSKSVKSVVLPIWWSGECEYARTRKEKLRKKYKKSGLDSDYAKFSAARSHFKNVCDSRSRQCLDMDTTDNISNKFWRQVKVNSKSTRIPEVVNDGKAFATDPESQANMFNQTFASNFSSPSKYDINIDNTDVGSSCEFSGSEVYTVLSTLNSRKGPGPDGLHSYVFKKCAGVLAYPLSLLFNQAYSCSDLPEIWKSANVVPVFKAGDKRDVRNYRPISLTCIAMKVFERMISSRLLDLCYDKIDKRQHGFLPGRSCLSQMINFTDTLFRADNYKLTSDIIYFDYKKAFDSVNHDIILEKLQSSYGITGKLLGLIRVYLMGRTQRVAVNGTFSAPHAVVSGVPQGSIIGPLLFVLFMNDVYDCLVGDTMALLYADDIKLFNIISSFSDQLDLQASVNNLYFWSNNNKMTLHPLKCKVISTCSPRCEQTWGQLPFFYFNYSLGGVDLCNVECQRDLGILVSYDLSWNDHVSYSLQLFSDRFNLLRRTVHFIKNPNQRRILYLSLVRSLLEHCSPVWSPHHKGLRDRLEAAQKRAIKWIFGISYTFSWSNTKYYEYLSSIKILPLHLHFLFNDLKLFYKVIAGLTNLDLPNYLSIKSPGDAPYRTRSNSNIIDMIDCTTVVCDVQIVRSPFRNSFFIRTFPKWNELPVNLRQSSSFELFSIKLKTHLFNSLTTPL